MLHSNFFFHSVYSAVRSVCSFEHRRWNQKMRWPKWTSYGAVVTYWKTIILITVCYFQGYRPCSLCWKCVAESKSIQTDDWTSGASWDWHVRRKYSNHQRCWQTQGEWINEWMKLYLISGLMRLIRPLAKMPELRGFAPFVIDPKLVMNSTICWNVLTHHFLI